MTNQILDLKKLHKELKLSFVQKKLLSDAFEKLIKAKQHRQHRDYFAGEVEGINDCFKVVNNIEDDYNHL